MGLKALEKLDLAQTRISDNGLESVGQLGNLKRLYLGSTAISDAGMANLSRLRNLQSLSLSHTDITDGGVAKLRLLPALPLVDLNGAFATEEIKKQFDPAIGPELSGLRTKADLMNLDNPADVAALRTAGLTIKTDRLRNVTRIDASWWEGSPGDWLLTVENLHSLTILELNRRTTDADLVHVCKIKSLQTLRIGDAGITDTGTTDIGSLTELRELVLRQCGA